MNKAKLITCLIVLAYRSVTAAVRKFSKQTKTDGILSVNQQPLDRRFSQLGYIILQTLANIVAMMLRFLSSWFG